MAAMKLNRLELIVVYASTMNNSQCEFGADKKSWNLKRMYVVTSCSVKGFFLLLWNFVTFSFSRKISSSDDLLARYRINFFHCWLKDFVENLNFFAATTSSCSGILWFFNRFRFSEFESEFTRSQYKMLRILVVVDVQAAEEGNKK